MENGALWAWGAQDYWTWSESEETDRYGYGGLGYGSTLEKNPEMHQVLDGVVAVSAASYHVLAVTYDGNLYGWGSGIWGNLSEKHYENDFFDSVEIAEYPETPSLIMSNVKAACAASGGGGSYSMVIKNDGSLWSFGENLFGQLGIGEEDMVSHPEPVKIMDDVAAVSASGSMPHVLAVKTDGTLWAWGKNNCGELGDGTLDEKSAPVKIMDHVASIATSDQSCYAIKTDGTLWAWGNNNCDRLTSIVGPNQTTPVKILDNVQSVSAGGGFTMAVKKDSTLWAWGFQGGGTLGDGVYDYAWDGTPKKIMDNVASVSAGSYHCLATKKDGTLWAWGDNDYGQLGNSNYETNVYTPQKIGSGFKIPAGVSLSAIPTKSSVLVNGTPTAFDAYNINGANYFKLRDLAYILNGTAKQFEVGWDAENQAISLKSNSAYTSVGGEMAVLVNAQARAASPTTSKIFANGKQTQFSAYNIGGNNYFKLRDVADAIDFGVTWDASTNTIGIDSSAGYEQS